jgi:hypothetical protein
MRQERIRKTPRRRPRPSEAAALLVAPAADVTEADDLLELIDAVLAVA